MTIMNSFVRGMGIFLLIWSTGAIGDTCFYDQAPGGCWETYVKTARWLAIEADNGTIYEVDVGHIEHGGVRATIIVYTVEGETFDPQGTKPGDLFKNPQNLTRLFFNCQTHHFQDMRNMRTSLYAPPRSVVGRIEAIACAEENKP